MTEWETVSSSPNESKNLKKFTVWGFRHFYSDKIPRNVHIECTLLAPTREKIIIAAINYIKNRCKIEIDSTFYVDNDLDAYINNIIVPRITEEFENNDTVIITKPFKKVNNISYKFWVGEIAQFTGDENNVITLKND